MRRPELVRWGLPALLLAACWPVWQWMALRAGDGSGDPWETISLLTAACFIWQNRRTCPLATCDLRLPALLVVLYTLSLPVLPPLFRAVLAMSAIAATFSALCFGKRMHFPLLGLFLLALPLIASLNFYLGYPLRIMTGSASAALLQLNGFAVVREGTLLAWDGHTIAVDAPCSGVKMLWAGLYLCCALAAFQGLDALRTVALCIAGVGVVLVANVLRATALFYIETDILALPKEWHMGVGVAIFVLSASAILLLASLAGGRAHVR